LLPWPTLPSNNQNTWDKVFIPCEHGTTAYKTNLKPKAAACTAVAKKFDC
jgi:hypothetical protein